MTTAIDAFAPAKINLTLHVTGQRADGYHLLDSLVVFADVGDRLVLTPGPKTHIDVTGPFAKGVPTDESNLVWKAMTAAGWSGQVALEKNLPHGAGIGGGSADAAAVLRAVDGDNISHGIGMERALALGADVPVCLHPGPQRMQGIGEILTRIKSVPALHLVLVNPGVAVSTPSVFKALRSRTNPGMPSCVGWHSVTEFLVWLRGQRNDLETAAMRLSPAIQDVFQALSDAALTRMSGSGATCFGIYENAESAQTAAHRIATAHPDWWVVACQSVGESA